MAKKKHIGRPEEGAESQKPKRKRTGVETRGDLIRQTHQRVEGALATSAGTEDDAASRGMRMERHATRTETHTGALATIKRWERIYHKKVEKETHVVKPEKKSRPPSTKGALVKKTGTFIGKYLGDLSETPLEDMRREKEFDTLRREAFEKLGQMADVRKGVRILSAWTYKHLGKRCTNMKHVNRYFPHLTATEVAFLPLLKKIPETFLLYGTGFDALAEKRKTDGTFGRDEQITSEDLQREIPGQMEMRVDGIAYGTDHTLVIAAKEEEEDEDSEANPSDREIVPFKSDIAQHMKELIALTIENPRLFERLRAKTADGLQLGVGIIQKEALARYRKKHPDASAATTPATAGTALVRKKVKRLELPGSEIAVPRKALVRLSQSADPQGLIEVLRDALDDVLKRDKKAYEEEEQALAEHLLKAEVCFPNGTRLTMEELTHFIGMLDGIPNSFLQKEPFRGTIAFYLDKFMISGPDGRIQEVCPLSRECHLSALHVIDDEMHESSTTNRTAFDLHKELVPMIQTPIAQALLDAGKHLDAAASIASPIERAAFSVFQKTGITLQSLPDQEFIQIGEGHATGGQTLSSSMKMGLEETEQYARLIDRLGNGLLGNVRKIEKIQMPELEKKAIMRGQIARAIYVAETQKVLIVEPAEIPYSELKKEAKHERDFLLAYACAQSHWHTMTVPERNRWDMFHRAGKQSGQLRSRLRRVSDHAEAVVIAGEALSDTHGPHLENCLTSVALGSEEADFCAHFACYILCHQEFAERAKGNRVIADKYKNIQTFIDKLSGEKRDFSDATLPAKQAAQGLRQQFPQLPDMDDFAKIKDWISDQEALAEGKKMDDEEAGDDEDNDEEAESDEEVSGLRSLVTLRQSAKDAFLAALDPAVEEMEGLERLCRRIAKVLLDESGGQAEEDVRDLLREHPALEEYELQEDADEEEGGKDSEQIEAIIRAMREGGLFEWEEMT